jgi:hypothetical protein
MRLVGAAIGLVTPLLLAGPGQVAGAKTTRARTSSTCHDLKKHKQTGSFYTKLYAPRGHHPKVGNYPIKVVARSPAGKPISGGHVFYQFLFGTSIVSCQTVGPKPAKYKPRFTRGVFRDVLAWPKRSVGYPIKLRVVVKTSYGLKNIDYAIRVRK